MSNQTGDIMSTQEMFGLANRPDLTIMARACRELEMLNTAACRTHAIWSSTENVFTTEDWAKFTNNIPGPIAVFKALEEQLLDEGLITSNSAQARVRPILRSMCDMKLPTDEDIKADPWALPGYFQIHLRNGHRLLFANTTWMVQLYHQLGKDGEPYGKISKANSFIQLLSPDEGDSDEERVARQMLIKLDLQQICVAAEWWLDVLTDNKKLVAELKTIRDLKAKLSNYEGPCLSDLPPHEQKRMEKPKPSHIEEENWGYYLS